MKKNYTNSGTYCNTIFLVIVLLTFVSFNSINAQTNNQEDGSLSLTNTGVAISPITLIDDFTISAWVNLAPGSTIDNRDGLVANANQDINFFNGNVRFFGGSDQRDIVIANTPAQTGVFTHYTFVRRNGIVSIYINGNLDATATNPFNENFIVENIGTSVAGLANGAGLNGQLEDFIIWNSARSVDQLRADMNGDIVIDSSLERIYTFNEGSGSALDLAGNANINTLPANAQIISEPVIPIPVISESTTTTPITPTTGNRAVQVVNSNLTVNDVSLPGDFSISAWVYFDESDPVNGGDILARGDGWSIDFDGGFFNVNVDEFGGSIVASNTPVRRGEWAFYSAVRENGFVDLYINGNFERTSRIDDSRTRATVNEPWDTAIQVSEIYPGMNAIIDDYRIYNRARSQVQVQSDLTGTLEGIGGLMRYFSFNGAIDAIIDETGNTANLARENGTEFTGFIAPFVVPRVANQFGVSQVVSSLILPTDLDFLPDGRLIVVEKSGIVRLFADPTQVNSDGGIYIDLSNVTNNEAERGMLAVVVDPDFENNRYVYLYNTFVNANNTISKAVVRYTHIEGAGGANSRLDSSSAFVIWREMEVALNSAANVHHGGGLDIAFEPINGNDPSPYKLYIVTSDESIPNSSRNLSSDNGKVHRVNLTDGSIPTDNPFFEAAAAANYNPQVNVGSSISSAGVLTTIHSSGVRNGWRASYDQESGFLLFGEVGGATWEDIHVAVPRADYGWNIEEGPLNNANDPGNPILSYNHTNGPGLNDNPLTGSASITGGVVYRGNQFPQEFEGVYFYGDWTRQWIRAARFDFSGNRPVLIEDNFFSNTTGRPLSFEEGPDGALYYLTTTQIDSDVFLFEGQVNRLSFDRDNTPPFGSGILVDAEDLTAVTIPHSVEFASNVFDAEGDVLSYNWSFGDGASSTESNPEHTYTELGSFEVTLTVTDANGAATSFESVFITIGGVPSITLQPSQTGTYRAGDVITIDGIAIDATDGRLAQGSLSWNSSYATEGSARPGPFENGTPYTPGGITFTTPDFGNVESFLNSVTIALRAENTIGLSASESITLVAERSSITVDAPNESVLIGIDGHITEPGDYTFEGIVNFRFDFEADVQFVENGRTFVFSHWSDDPSITNPIRQIAMPATPTNINPIYIEQGVQNPNPGSNVALFDFETGDLQGATITSGAFGQIVSDREFFIIGGGTIPYDNRGDYFLNTLEIDSSLPRGTDSHVGTITSPLYTLEGGTVSLLVGGGSNSDLVYFAVFLEDGTEIGRVSRDTNGESMQAMQINVAPFIGQNIFWEVVDKSTDGFGYIAVDDIAFEGTLVTSENNNSVLFDFETGDLQGATITSGAFGQIVSDREFFIIGGGTIPYDNGGDYFLNTLEIDSSLPIGTDSHVGTITSPLYTLEGSTVSLLVGGGSNSDLVYFAVFLEDGTEIGRVSRSTNGESMQLMRINVASYIGQNIFWHVVDNSTDGFGYIAVDDIAFEGTLVGDNNTADNSEGENSTMSLSLNPVEEMLFINSTTPVQSSALLQIYSSSGNLVKEAEVVFDNEVEASLYVGDLDTGVYTVLILDPISGQLNALRMIKR